MGNSNKVKSEMIDNACRHFKSGGFIKVNTSLNNKQEEKLNRYMNNTRVNEFSEDTERGEEGFGSTGK